MHTKRQSLQPLKVIRGKWKSSQLVILRIQLQSQSYVQTFLRAIAERPGRIYESKQTDFNLLNETISGLETMKEMSKAYSKKTVAGN